MSASEDGYLRTNWRTENQLITAKAWQDWGWHFDILQQEVKS